MDEKLYGESIIEYDTLTQAKNSLSYRFIEGQIIRFSFGLAIFLPANQTWLSLGRIFGIFFVMNKSCKRYHKMIIAILMPASNVQFIIYNLHKIYDQIKHMVEKIKFCYLAATLNLLFKVEWKHRRITYIYAIALRNSQKRKIFFLVYVSHLKIINEWIHSNLANNVFVE